MNLTKYILHLADDALILGHRNSEWTGHGPILEQDIALSNIALDLIGQARHLYQYAAERIGEDATEDTLAYLRAPDEYLNCLLVEQENGHWGKTILRQFFFSAYQHPLYERLTGNDDQRIAAIAEKSLKEITYHLRWSGEWVVRLGRGTAKSRSKMNEAIDELWKFTGELFMPAPYETADHDTRPDGDALIKAAWSARVSQIADKAGLALPEDVEMLTGGKEGRHSGHLLNLLGEMQYLQRTYPNCEW